MLLPTLCRATLISVIFTTALTVRVYSSPVTEKPDKKILTVIDSEEIEKQRPFHTLFAKIPQDSEYGGIPDILSGLPYSPKISLGYTNQIAKILFPSRGLYSVDNHTNTLDGGNYINIPVLKQPYDDYMILIVTAPPMVRISGDDAKPLVLYVVFPNDTKSNAVKIPTVYFVNAPHETSSIKKENYKPIIIVDNNRTVTGIRSKEISKFVKFKNKMTNNALYKS